LGKTLWAIADQLRGAMNADDFRDYMLSFLFLRYLSDNYEASAKKELEEDYPRSHAPAWECIRMLISTWYGFPRWSMGTRRRNAATISHD